MAKAQEQGAVLEAPNPTIKPTVVQESFKHVMMYDFSVLFYFFAMLASCVWSFQGAVWEQAPGLAKTAVCSEKDSLDTANARWWGMAMFWVCFLYSTCWYCCSCCAGSVQLSQPIT